MPLKSKVVCIFEGGFYNKCFFSCIELSFQKMVCFFHAFIIFQKEKYIFTVFLAFSSIVPIKKQQMGVHVFL